jgi:uncharacterized protein (DUF1330 family)
VIAEVQLVDPVAFRAYAAKVAATLAPYHGRYIVRGKPKAKEVIRRKGRTSSWHSTTWLMRRNGIARRRTGI